MPWSSGWSAETTTPEEWLANMQFVILANIGWTLVDCWPQTSHLSNFSRIQKVVLKTHMLYIHHFPSCAPDTAAGVGSPILTVLTIKHPASKNIFFSSAGFLKVDYPIHSVLYILWIHIFLFPKSGACFNYENQYVWVLVLGSLMWNLLADEEV